MTPVHETFAAYRHSSMPVAAFDSFCRSEDGAAKTDRQLDFPLFPKEK
mgnify:CR=1 FL=1